MVEHLQRKGNIMIVQFDDLLELEILNKLKKTCSCGFMEDKEVDLPHTLCECFSSCECHGIPHSSCIVNDMRDSYLDTISFKAYRQLIRDIYDFIQENVDYDVIQEKFNAEIPYPRHIVDMIFKLSQGKYSEIISNTCKNCNTNLDVGKQPIEYNGNKYCKPLCLFKEMQDNGEIKKLN